MTASRKQGTCPLCGALGDLTQEHVLPRWLLKRWPDEAGPYTTYLDKTPAKNRCGKVRRTGHIGRVTLDICEQCRRAINDRYETPTAKVAIRALLDEGSDLTTQVEVDAVARWIIKTFALYQHPRSLHHEHVFRNLKDGRLLADRAPVRPWNPFPTDLARSLATDTALPAVSVWMARAVDQPSDAGPPVSFDTLTNPKPDLVCTIGFNTIDDAHLFFQLAYHPGSSTVDHPFAASRQVIQLWPSPPRAVSLSSLAPVSQDSGLPSAFVRWRLP